MASESDAPKQNDPKTIGKGDTSEKSNNKTPPALRAELQIPQPAIDAYKTQQNKSQRIQWLNFWVTLATLTAVVVYAAITYLQWGEMRKSTEAAKKTADISAQALENSVKTFKQQHRAYLLIAAKDGVSFIDELSAGKPLKVNIRAENSGRSPAINVVVDKRILIEPNAVQKVKRLPFPQNSTWISAGILPVGGRAFITAEAPPITTNDLVPMLSQC